MGKSYHIYGQFFSSVSLYKNLLAENLYCMGTLRSNRRNFPPDLKDAAKRGLACRGDRVVRQDGNVSICVWQDTRPVTFMSSGHNPAHTKSIRRKKGDGSSECPVSIVDYFLSPLMYCHNPYVFSQPLCIFTTLMYCHNPNVLL